MSEQLEQTLSKILDKSIELAEKTGEFVIEQGTDLLQQFFMWHTTEAVMGIIIGICVLIVGFFIPRTWSHRDKTKKLDIYEKYVKIFGRYYIDNGSEGAAIIILVISLIAGWVVILVNLYNLVYILIAPKLYLIEYFMK